MSILKLTNRSPNRFFHLEIYKFTIYRFHVFPVTPYAFHETNVCAVRLPQFCFSFVFLRLFIRR